MRNLCDACGLPAGAVKGEIRDYEGEGGYHDDCAEELAIPESKMI